MQNYWKKDEYKKKQTEILWTSDCIQYEKALKFVKNEKEDQNVQEINNNNDFTLNTYVM